jgi:hypothetical protein
MPGWIARHSQRALKLSADVRRCRPQNNTNDASSPGCNAADGALRQCAKSWQYSYRPRGDGSCRSNSEVQTGVIMP